MAHHQRANLVPHRHARHAGPRYRPIYQLDLIHELHNLLLVLPLCSNNSRFSNTSTHTRHSVIGNICKFIGKHVESIVPYLKAGI
ncbi:hypothetical protein TRAPUB_9549 [Trametes pubescens]|uniref:Uncharacterized protein n=1 Tax=Trametes pubescens TaxID=154538 RepID=A0A1M2W281_TRAPU|nr:hypothetical protein TRAPUB_9549 [Trametes pubescens]